MLGGFAERFGVTRDQALRLGCAFGGGVARTAQTCGAVNGALLVLGLAHGQVSPSDAASRDRTYAATRELLARFRERHGSIVCLELLGVHIGTPEGREVALRTDLFRTRCPSFVRTAAELVRGLV